MKKLLILVLSLLSVNAFATKARLTALGSSFHLVDEQFGYTNPMNFHFLGNMVALETGLTTSTNTRNNAEGLVSYGMSDTSRIVFELGKNDDNVLAGRTLINSIVGAGTYIVPQNMAHLFYGTQSGDMIYYGGVYYSNKDDKFNNATESSSGLSFSVKSGPSILFVNYSLVNSVEAAAGTKFDGAGNVKLALRHRADDMVYGLDVISWTAKSSTAGTENESFGNQSIFLRALKSTKAENGSEVFYGAQVVSTTVTCKVTGSAACSTKFARMTLPVWIGVEANAADWLTIRGSITQTVLVNSTKDDIGLPATSGVSGANGAVSDLSAAANNTAVAAGLGFKFKSITVDGTLAGATTQALNQANFLSQLGMTYKF